MDNQQYNFDNNRRRIFINTRTLRRIGLSIFLLAALMFGWTSISVIFFRSSNEILYKGEIIVSTCTDFFQKGQKDLKNCVTIYELRVGNTGKKDQEKIKVLLPSYIQFRSWDHKILDIMYDAKKRARPKIKKISEHNHQVYEIQPFPENKIVILKLFTTGYTNYQALKDVRIEVHAEGKVVEADPQITTLARIFRAFFGIFF